MRSASPLIWAKRVLPAMLCRLILIMISLLLVSRCLRPQTGLKAFLARTSEPLALVRIYTFSMWHGH